MWLELLPFVVAGFAAGFVDAIAGGGGLITVPVLLGMGLPPHAVLATNKGQACLGAASSLYTYVSRGGVDRERLRAGFGMGFLGALGGALLVLAVPAQPLRPIMLALLLAAGVVSLTQKRWARATAESMVRGSRRRFWLLAFMLAMGVYDGFFGPGTGMLLIVGFVHWFGDGHTRASGNAKVANFGSNLASLIVFQAHSAVLWQVALPMGLANIVGANLGARLALKRGDTVVRAVVLVGLLAVSAKVLFDLLS